MSTTTSITVNAAQDEVADHSQEVLLVACLIIALLFLLVGLAVLRRRRHRDEGKHIVVDVAEPEGEQGPPAAR